MDTPIYAALVAELGDPLTTTPESGEDTHS